MKRLATSFVVALLALAVITGGFYAFVVALKYLFDYSQWSGPVLASAFLLCGFWYTVHSCLYEEY